ncbi:RNA ligase family protein [Natrinema zhouii]|uniref:RNA ligase domain-containing protein n=1 Tax=Natrinema zhouii TaxID=1710539 RepID=A0A7D6CRV0_9EURY|nr:RNA ligase family protein [Natrinema zhouii]QLK27676.1 RNA ligase family protein [Natrinema zhouii]
MKRYPSIPRIENAPRELFDTGHLWLLEKVDGANFRFQLQRSGRIQFGDRNRWYSDPDAIPEPYHHAVRHVRDQLDRDALRRAVDDVESIVFFGEAMHRHAIEYEWDRTPSVLGFDIWAAAKDAFYPPDTAEQIFERVGLQPVNAFERERHTRDFDPESYTVPQSNWYDGPAEGVVIRNKQGQRAKLLHPDHREVDETVPIDGTASELAATYVTQRRIENVAAKLEDRQQPVTVEAVYERVLEDIVREEHARLSHGNQTVDMEPFRSAVGRVVRQSLEKRYE